MTSYQVQSGAFSGLIFDPKYINTSSSKVTYFVLKSNKVICFSIMKTEDYHISFSRVEGEASTDICSTRKPTLQEALDTFFRDIIPCIFYCRKCETFYGDLTKKSGDICQCCLLSKSIRFDSIESCSICLNPLIGCFFNDENSPETISKTECGHFFHYRCLERVRKNDPIFRCPICRAFLLDVEIVPA